MLGHQSHQLLRRLLIREQGVDLVEVAEVDHGIAPELGVVGGQEHLAGVGDDGLGYLHLVVVEIEQGAVVVDTGYADDAIVHAELADEVAGRLPDDAPVPVADLATGDDDSEVILGGEDAGHVEVVGDHPQLTVIEQGAGDGLGGGADVDEER